MAGSGWRCERHDHSARRVIHNVVLHNDGAHGDGDAADATWANIYSQTSPQGVYKLLFRSIGRNERGELAPRLLQRYVTLQELEPDPRDPNGGGGTQDRLNCEGSAAAYLIGSYDLRNGSRNVVHVINPTERTLEIVVALFDDQSRPLRCERGRLGPNDIQEFLINILDPPNDLGVVRSYHSGPALSRRLWALSATKAEKKSVAP